ncbi:MAG: hypothetical protein JSU63_08300 [Phycisphaerales bacterium]|nr:MAG: hypothetical protein JSU63_08300 [Phycisphaerales bacterium]
MKSLKRHWRGMFVVCAVPMLCGIAWWHGGSERTALADEPYDPLTRVQRSGIINVLEEISLDRDALIALNLSAEQAESVMDTVRSWYLTNAATLATLQEDLAEAKHDVLMAKKVIAKGPANPANDAALAVARDDRADAKAAYASAFSSLKSSINSELTESQRTTWTAIQSGWGQNMPLRMLSLSDEQRIAISKAERGYRWRQAAAESDSDRANAVSARETAWTQILTETQRSVIDAYRSYYATSSAHVATAFDTVLAVEEQG